MKLTYLFSLFFLCITQLFATSSIEVICQQHLNNPEGRSTFLLEKLLPMATLAQQWNEEIQEHAETMKALSSEKDQKTILFLAKEINQKMNKLLKILPILNLALSIDKDFEQIDAILNMTDPLSPQQQEIIDRLASLCNALEAFSLPSNKESLESDNLNSI